MTEFVRSPDEGQQEFFGPSAPPANEVPESLTETLINYYSAALDKDPAAVELDLTSGNFPILKHEASARANEAGQKQTQFLVDQIIEEQPDEASAIAELERVRSQLDLGNHITPDVAVMLNEDTEFSAIEKRVVERVFAAQRIIEAKRGQAASGTPAAIGYWFDTAFSSIVQNVAGAQASITGIGDETLEGAGQLRELAREASQLIFSGTTEEDFEARFTDIMDRVADAGLFSEDNPLYFETFLDMVREGGEGFTSEVESIFQAVDIISLGSLKGATKAGATIRTMSKIGSRSKAKDVVVRYGDTGKDSELLSEGTSASIITPAKPDIDYYSAPELEAMRELEAGNAALNAIKTFNWGDIVDPAIVASKKEEWIGKIREATKQWKRQELDYDIRIDTSGNIFGVAALGKRGGKPYATIKNAQAFADKIGGEVVPQLVEGKTQYIVVKEIAIPTEGLANPTEIKQVATGLLASIMSTTARTTVNLDAILKRGEAQTVRALKELGGRYKAAKRAVKRTEVQLVDNILREARDDPNFNWRRNSYTDEEFATRYTEKYGTAPSQAVVEYYKTVRDISDVDYFINADILLKEAINNNELMVKLDGQYYRSKKATPEADDTVLKADGTLVKYSDLDPERVVIYEIKDFAYAPEGVGMVRYVEGNGLTTRRLYHTDVMPYNMGGHRTYTDPWNFFIKQEKRELTLAGGKKVQAKPITFMAVRTESEALLVKQQFNRIAEAFEQGLSKAKINKIVLANNNWNRSIESADDFSEFVTEQGMTVTDKINFAGDGEPLVGQAFAGADTIGNSFRSGLNASKTRGSRPLLGFGGDELDSLDPTQAIERGFAQTVSRKGDQSYLFNAINGWLKVAEREGAILNANDLVGMSPKQKLQRATLSSFTDVGKALERERKTIQYRLSNTTAQVAREQEIMRGFADYAYGRGWDKGGKALDWLSTKDPAGFIRAMAFHTKLGLFAVDQLYVQASQLINVMGITSSNIGTLGAIRGMLSIAPMRLALVEGIPDAALKRIAKIQAPFTNISPEDFIQLRDWVKMTGRNVINRTAIEENNAAASLTGIGQSRFLEYGQTFFNEGELIARLGAAANNLLERRAKFPDENIFDDAVVRQMIHRQDVLTASMTSASSAPWQKSLLAVPLQFTTYHVRLVEQLFTAQILSPKERLRLGLTHLFAYGTAAVPAAGYLQDKMGYDGAIDPSTGLYDLVRYGALDTVLSTLSGTETALSARLAVGEGLFDLFTRLREDGLWEIAAGPGGSITIDTVGALSSMVTNIFAGKFDHISYDWNRFARNITSYNRAYTLWMGARFGEYYSRKTENPLLSDMSAVDVVIKGLGIPLEEERLLWATMSNQIADKKALEIHLKEIKRLDTLARRAIENNEIDTAAGFMEDIGAMLDVLTNGERETVMARLRQDMTIQEVIVRKLMQEGKFDLADQIRGITE